MWAYGGRLKDDTSLRLQSFYLCRPAVAFSSKVQNCTGSHCVQGGSALSGRVHHVIKHVTGESRYRMTPLWAGLPLGEP